MKNEKKKADFSSEKNKIDKKNISNKPKNVKIKKKTKISFGRKKNKNLGKNIINEDKETKSEKLDTEIEESELHHRLFYVHDTDSDEKNDRLEDVVVNDQETETVEKEVGKQWSSQKKKKKILTKDMKGKPVYLEATGEKLGMVYDMMYDGDNNLIGYKVKDRKTDSVLCFPIDQFDQAKDGLIFVQGWYTKAVKTIEKLEFKERVSPELTTLISDDAISNEELYNIFVKHDDEMVNYIEEAAALKELLHQHLDALEKQRLALKGDLMDLTEKRLIKDIDRREFSEDVMKHRHKVNILDVNIKKCKELLGRLDKTSFGRLGKEIIANIDGKNRKDQYLETFQKSKEPSGLTLTEEIENPYKQKYDDIKERFDQLQENYNELKAAVERLVEKGEL